MSNYQTNIDLKLTIPTISCDVCKEARLYPALNSSQVPFLPFTHSVVPGTTLRVQATSLADYQGNRLFEITDVLPIEEQAASAGWKIVESPDQVNLLRVPMHVCPRCQRLARYLSRELP